MVPFNSRSEYLGGHFSKSKPSYREKKPNKNCKWKTR